MHQTAERSNVLDERPDVPVKLAEICSQMMARRPEERLQTAAEVVAKLSSVFP
jgi:hypothetical protein